ncbi:hypothetical protein [Sphingomonas sp.]|uniref:hypothetical protein n=1 Tax=Sphingomonas sp. TaxID=28214 RepID=UPI001B2110C8|nr:hypothetical protein [Sphingomonas sp.]MBO9712138.1 hypothetical protein [Sphingomonas sp.]
MSLMLALALAATPMPAMASVPVACVYDSFRKTDWATMVKVARNGLNGTTADEKDMVSRIGETAQMCRVRYGWSTERMNVAIGYFVGRVLSSNCTHDLRDRGVDFDKLKTMLGALSKEEREQLIGGAQAQMAPLYSKALAAGGIDPASIPEADRAAFDEKLKQGLLGLIIEQDAEARFAAM